MFSGVIRCNPPSIEPSDLNIQSQLFLVFNSSIEFIRRISSEYVLFCILLNCRPVKVN